MKIKLSLIILSLLLLGRTAMAQTAQNLTVSATLPAATSLALSVTPVDAVTGAATGASVQATTSIPFGTLTYNSTYGIYVPANGYYVAIATNGAGAPIVA